MPSLAQQACRVERGVATRLGAARPIPAGEFLEVYVDTPLELCRQRSEGGLYSAAREGRVQHSPGKACHAWGLTLLVGRQGSVPACLGGRV